MDVWKAAKIALELWMRGLINDDEFIAAMRRLGVWKSDS